MDYINAQQFYSSRCIYVIAVSSYYLWGESVADRVDMVIRCRAHKGVGVAGEAMAVGGQTVGGAAVSAGQTTLVHS